jgi:glutaminyl-tRNA synthetase
VEKKMSEAPAPSNFIKEAIEEDLRAGRYNRVQTRFPPEPNGYLHIGHAKAICIDFGLAEAFGGKGNLRYDDTNPVKEDTEYVDAIKEDIHWLGYDWEDREFYASDYFEQLYQWAVALIQKGKAYVCDLSADEVREYRGTLTEPGKESPYRNRSVEENLDLFERMRRGEFPEGSRTLRAKIDMTSPNINLRDPVMYRILYAHHHRTGDKWCIYPMYDYAHGQSDSIEGVTHSLCDINYEIHRPLYEWFLDELGIFKPRQIEFARLELTYTILSKRFLKQLVEKNHVRGWNDPRMPTLCGMRRRGYPAEAIRDFIDRAGVAKSPNIVEITLLEHCVRENLNKNALRVMGVLDPLKVVLTNYPAGQVEELDAVNNPEDPAAGSRKVPFCGELYIERDDFRETPPPKYFRLAPGKEVRLRYGYFIRCEEVVKDAEGNVVELRCTYDPETRGGYAPDGRKVQGTLHWVSARHALDAEVRLYDRLFVKPDPGNVEEGKTYLDYVNPNAETVLTRCKVEPSLGSATVGARFQFERLGYFCLDPDTHPGKLAFNRTVDLRDTWAKIEKK